MGEDPSEPLGGVADTALGAAEMRAEESLRSDRIIDDPFASAFVAAAPPLFPDVPALVDDADLAAMIEAGVAGVAVRTRFFDEYLEAACAAGVRQVVLLAAGLDTRAFRLTWPDGMELFEVDLPEVFGFKEQVLNEQGALARCERRLVSADLRDDWSRPLTVAGFDARRTTAWTAEGLLVYLTSDDAAGLLIAIGGLSAPGSRLAFDHDLPDQESSLRRAQELDGMAGVASMWQGGLAEHPTEWLTRHGWEADSVAANLLARTYARDLVNASGAFFTATKA